MLNRADSNWPESETHEISAPCADFRINQEDDGLHVAAQTTNASNLLRECGYSAWETVVGPHEGRVLLEIIEERGLTVISSPILDMSPRWTTGWQNENK